MEIGIGICITVLVGGANVPAAALRWPDGVAVTWPDAAYLRWPA